MNYNFVGNQKIKQELYSLVKSSHMPSAIILEGSKGIGKLTLAREIATSLMCISDDKPCYECAQCRKVMHQSHPDVIEFFPKKNTFKVDDVREIKKDAFVKPNEANYKVYILGDCQKMNASSQNAILKILEEPPKYVVFILLVDTKSSFLETILSRCVCFSLKGVEPNEGANYITENNAEISYEDALTAINAFDGNIGKSIESLNDGEFAELSKLCETICKQVTEDNEYELLIICKAFSKNREKVSSVMTMLGQVFRDALFYNQTNVYISGNEELAKMLSKKLSSQKLCDLTKVCEELKIYNQQNANDNIMITKICYELRRAVGR